MLLVFLYMYLQQSWFNIIENSDSKLLNGHVAFAKNALQNQDRFVDPCCCFCPEYG